jgi:hypothetical protein
MNAHLDIYALEETSVDTKTLGTKNIVRIIDIPTPLNVTPEQPSKGAGKILSHRGGLHTKLTRVSQTMIEPRS